MSHKKSYLNHEGGLLMTTVVGIGIFSFLAMISIPAYVRFKPNIELSGVTRDLVTDLRYAQQMTISEQKIYAIDIDNALNRYSIISLDIATTTIKTVILPVNVQFQSINGFSDNLIRFNSYGAVSEAGDITLVNNNSLTKSILIKPSGYVQTSQ